MEKDEEEGPRVWEQRAAYINKVVGSRAAMWLALQNKKKNMLTGTSICNAQGSAEKA